jgi:hypothetical protein
MSRTHFDSNSIEATSDRLTGRAGIASFAQYIDTMGLPEKMAETFPKLKKSKKGVGTKDFFCFDHLLAYEWRKSTSLKF